MVDPRGAHARARFSRRNLVFGWVHGGPLYEGFRVKCYCNSMFLFVRGSVWLIRGEPTRGRDSRAATLYSVGSMGDPDHEATIRFGGEAPRRRPHSGHGFKAMAVFGSPPPRIMISGLSQCEGRPSWMCCSSIKCLSRRTP
jgi:hypothetical protein